MKPIEKLARDICWVEFPNPPKDTTKAAYWRDQVAPEKKAEYIRDAEWLVFIAKQFKPLRILGLVDLRALERRKRR